MQVAIKAIQKTELYQTLEDYPEIVLNYSMKQLGIPKTHIVSPMEYLEDEHYIYVVTKWANDNLVDYLKIHSLPLLTERELKAPSLKIIEALKIIHKVGFLHNSI